MKTSARAKTKKQLLGEIRALKGRLEEAEETLRAIQSGEVDALVVSGPQGERIFTLEGAERPYRVLLETMSEGALTLAPDGTVLYCNRCFAELVKTSLDKVIGASIHDFIPSEEEPRMGGLLQEGQKRSSKSEISLNAMDGTRVFAHFSILPLPDGELPATCAVVTDLTQQKEHEEIAASERLSRIILEQATDAIIVCDRTGTIIRASLMAHWICGRNPLNQPFDAALPLDVPSGPGDQRKVLTFFEMLEGKVAQGTEVRLTRADGRVLDLLLSAGPLRDEQGEVLATVITLADITERKLAEQKLERARTEAENERLRLEALMEALPVGVGLTNLEGGMLRSNKSFEEMWGSPRPATQSVGDYALYKAWWSETGEPVAPEEWASAQVAETGQAVVGQLMEIERFDGSHASVINSGAPVFDAEGKLTGCAVAIQDITDLRNAQRALRESEERYRNLVEVSPDAIVVHADGRFAYVNPAALELYGARREEDLLGRPVLDLIRSDERGAVSDRMDWIQGGKGTTTPLRETCILGLDGTERDVEVTAVGILYNGQPAVQAVLRDITVRKRMEKALERSEAQAREHAERLQAVLDAAPSIIWIAHDKECRRITGNREAYTFSQVPIGDDLSKSGPTPDRLSHYRIFEDGMELTAPEMPIQRVAASGQRVRGCAVDFVFEDGTVRSLLGNVNPLFDPEGQPNGAIAAFMDITGRKQAERALRESEERLRRMIETSPIAIGFGDSRGKIFEANDSFYRLTGYTREEIQASYLGWDQLTAPEYAVLDRQVMATLAATGSAGPYEKEYICKDGSRVPLLLSVSKLPDRDEHIAFIVDITERKRMEEALEKSEGRYRMLVETASQLLATDKPQAIVNELCQKVMTYLDCHAFFNYLVDEETQRLHLNAYEGIPEETGRQIEWLDYGVAVCGCAARDACRIVAEDIPNTPDPRTDLVKSFGIKAYACHPLLSAGRVIGTLSFGTRSRTTFSEDELSLMKTVADQVSTAMEKARLVEALQRSRGELERRVRQRTSELVKTSELLERVFSGMDVSIAYMDKDFNFIRVNRAYAEVDQREPEFYVGKNHFTLYPNEENEKIFRKVVETGETYSVYARPFSYAEHPERGLTYWDWSLQPVKEIDGSVGGVVLSMVDVTERVRAQEAMSRNEALLRTVFETLPVGIWLADKEGRIVHGNPAGQQIWAGARYVGMDRLGEYKAWWVDTGKRIEAEEWAIARAVRNGETSINEEIEIECFDGSHKIILNSAVPIRGEKQEIIGAFVVNHDISERRQAQKAAEAERKRFNDVLESLPAYLVLLTPDYHVRFANRYFRERFGESGGRRCFEYLFGRSEACEVCESFVPLKTQAPHKWKWNGPDGRNYDVSDFLLTDTDGSTLILEMGIDVTEQRQAEDALKSSSRYVRSLIEASLDPLVTISPEGKVTDVNRATELVTGVSREKLIGSDFSMYFTEPEKARQGYETVFSKGSVRDYPLAIRHTSGVFTDVLYNATVYKNEAGEVQGVFAAARDISEQKKTEKALRSAEDRLRQMQKMEALGTLAGGIAHDFNNILMPIQINTELALFDVPAKSPAANSLQLVLSAANRGREMVKQITTFSRMKVQEHRPLEIATVVKEALTFIKSSLPKHIQIQDEIQTESLMVAADPTQIQQVLMNLCGNAADAMRENGGFLRVTLEEVAVDGTMVSLEPGLKVGPYVRLTVSDTGTGMAPDLMVKVFDPFFTTKDPAGGTGMGLPIVHGIVKSHGGVVMATSEVDKGSTFTVYLPRVEAEAEKGSPDESPISTGKETILVVDDEEYQVRSIREMLERLGYQVTGKTRSLEALELFRAQPQQFDLVITDEVMPVMTGSKLAQELLKIRPDLPIILCTGYSEAITADRVEKIGIQELMMKPFGIREIAKTIRKVLDG